MGIVGEDVARVRAAADFVQVASEHVALKKVGRRWQGLCPFHSEKTPSFSVNAEEGLYYCFGCQASGDVITFVRDVRSLDFVSAVEWLATRFGVELHYDEPEAGHDRSRRAALVDAVARAVEWYHQRLLTAPDAGPARSYLRSRGYGRDVVESFRLGWAPDEWDALSSALKLTDDVLRDSGLGFLNRLGRQQDAFRARVLFPIFDAGGTPVAFGGRLLPGADGPKYKNSQESAIYSKSRTLYGLNWAKAEAGRLGEVVVCEGYTDVIAFFQAGVARAVATCGTSLADGHFRTLKNFARRVVLAYDADAAGQAAAQKFYEWEQRYEVDLAVADLPPGSDPADVGRREPERLRDAAEGARPFLAFRLERVLAGADLTTPEGRSRAAEAAVAVVAEHPNELVRDQYVMVVADRCRVDPDRLRDRAHGRGRRGMEPSHRHDRRDGHGPEASEPGDEGGGRRPERRASAPPRDASAEVEALRLAVHRPELVADRLERFLFAEKVHLAAFDALSGAHTLADAVATAPSDAADLLRRLAVEDTEADPDDVVARVVEHAAARALADIRAEARRAASPTDYAPLIGWVKLSMEQLRDAATRVDASGQLVAWLRQRGEEGR